MAEPTPRGTVYLVGAGPGDPELMTLKAARLLSEAEAVVHDALVDPSILERISPRAERWYAGKRGGDHYLTQDQINELLLELARRLDRVVRLKGGDPYLFGRGAEEQEFLVTHGVRVEVVPGLTSALAVPACAGIPLTHRDHASMAVVVTGHQRVDGRFESVDWAQLGALPATLSILMGVKNIEEVVSGLLRGGRPPETCAAVIQWGTTERQRVVEATLATIVEQVKIHRVGAPAVLVIGEVVGLRRKLTGGEPCCLPLPEPERLS